MVKKGKNKPNAPEYQHMLQQPPHNPYYPDISSTSSLLQPPPYSELTVPLSAATTNSVPMSHINRGDYPRQTPIIIHSQPQVSIPYDHRAERYNRRIRSYNSQLLLISIMAIVLSIASFRLYAERTCISGFTVHKVDKFDITIGKVREFHLYVAYASAAILFLCFTKSLSGKSKSHGCYLFLIGMSTFAVTLFTGYLAYLSFYSPCSLAANDIFSKTLKSVVGAFTDSLPSPDKGVFSEANVLNYVNEDRYGVLIFIFDIINFVFYLAAFLTATLMC